MAITAENLAEKYGISRERLRRARLSSQKRWAAATPRGLQGRDRPVELTRRRARSPSRRTSTRARDHARGLAKLPPVFKKDGVVTAGNASGICDGAAALVSPPKTYAEGEGPHPARAPRRWGVAGVEPSHHGHRPRARDPRALARAGLGLKRHRSVRGQRGLRRAVPRRRERARPAPRAHQRERRRHRLGHPLGASGARITTHLALRAARRTSIPRGGRYARGGQRLHRRRSPGPRRGAPRGAGGARPRRSRQTTRRS
jgi:acetyl-CoA acyltransferase 2